MFKTSDGYTLYHVGGKWVDNLDPDAVDLSFDADQDGWPLGGERLSGIRFFPHVEKDSEGKEHNTICVLLDDQRNLIQQVENNAAGRLHLQQRYGLDLSSLTPGL